MATHEIPLITDENPMTDAILAMRGEHSNPAVLCQLGGGILKFAGVVFPDQKPDAIFAQSNDREPEGRGPHFDVYDQYLNPDFPWLGLFNLSGDADLVVADLPTDLAETYFRMYPHPTDEAFDARRHFSAIALGNPNAEKGTGRLKNGTGLVMVQRRDRPQVIHDIVPDHPEQPGKYLKLIVPSGAKDARKRMESGGYKTLDEVISEGIGMESPWFKDIPAMDREPLHLRIPRISPELPKRRCNLD